jgi:hypothetical protein
MSMMDKKTMLKKVLLQSVDFLTLLPFLVGATLGLGAWALDVRSGLWYFGSVILMLLSGLIYGQRTALGWNRIVARVLAKWQEEQDQAREQKLDDLGLRLKGDGDSRTDELLGDLRVVARDLAREVGQSSGWVRSMTADTMTAVDQLFGACIQYLEKSLELYASAQSIKDKAIRRKILDEREKLIEEVQKSLHQLGDILMNVRAINLKYATTAPTGSTESDGLAQLRHELGLKLQAAREVEEAVNNPGQLLSGPDRKKYIDKAKATKETEGGG